MKKPKTFCVNHTKQILAKKTSPIFRSDRLDSSMHHYCEYCRLASKSEAISRVREFEFNPGELLYSYI